MATGWTLQPSGTRFDPPIEVHIPNTDGLSPGTVVPVVQWDHDMGYFVPMGLGTISEDGSELVTNKGSGITKAGWGGLAVPLNSDNAQCDANSKRQGLCGCDVTIKADDQQEKLWKLLKKDGTSVKFTAEPIGDDCNEDDVIWAINSEESGDNAFYEELNPKHNFKKPDKYHIIFTMGCNTCTEGYVQKQMLVNIFLPDFKIEKDEDHENGWFELIPQNGGQYYAERTNLKITVKYPEKHPEKGGKVIEDYSEKVLLKEFPKDPITNQLLHYQGDYNSTKLPKKDLRFNNGITKFHLDSVSYAKNDFNWPKSTYIKIQQQYPKIQDVDELNKLEIEQWVDDSKFDISGNGYDNVHLMPDWFEKKVWDIINKAKSLGGNISLSFSNLKRVEAINSSPSGECGLVSSDNDDIASFNVLCRNVSKIDLRINLSKFAESLIFHEARHTWQFLVAQTTTDFDDDYIPKRVSAISIVGGVPFQEKSDKTRGDYINDLIFSSGLTCTTIPIDEPATCDNPYYFPINIEMMSFSRFSSERDASRFECTYARQSYCP